MSSQQYLASISENASRFGMRLQETLAEHTRELKIGRGTGAVYLEAAGAGGVGGGLGGDDKIRKQLESSSDREKLDAMKKLVALISKNLPASAYFAQVVKNVASQNLEIRKLVYIYLLRYASSSPDLALLSVNSFQRDLGDANPLIRAMALRVLSGMQVAMVAGVVRQAIATAARDPSPYVRKAAALAVGKCYSLDPGLHDALVQILTGTLLRDRSPLALGAVAVAFNALCPARLDLLHTHYRRLCRVLVDMDEWGQVEVMGLLLRYARTMLVRPGDGEGEMDKDLKLLLESVEPVFQSRNPAVVLAATRVYFYAAPPSLHARFVAPLLRLLSVSPAVERVVLVDVRLIARRVPQLFAPHWARFVVRAQDAVGVRREKVALLGELLGVGGGGEGEWAGILREFVEYANDPDDGVVDAAVRAIGRCAARVPESGQQCLTALMTMLKSPHDTVVSSAVLVLKHLVQTQLSGTTTMGTTTTAPLDIVAHLAQRIDDIRHAQARACVVWLVGQYAGSSVESTTTPGVPAGLAPWAPDVLRKLAKTFGSEAALVKLQAVTLAGKLAVLTDDAHLGLLVKYVLQLARYDVNYDVRDRGRMIAGLLVGVGVGVNGEKAGVVLRREQVRVVLFEGKKTAVDEKPGLLDDERVLVGSLARVTGRGIGVGPDGVLPDWLERAVEGALRDSEEDAAPPAPVATAISSAGPVKGIPRGVVSPPIVLTPTGVSRPSSRNGTKGPWTDLDSFYADAEEPEEEEEEGDDDDEDAAQEDEDSGTGSEEGSGSEESESAPEAELDDNHMPKS